MKNLLFVAILLASILPASAQNSVTASDLDRYLSARTELGRFSGSVLIAKGDNVIFRKAYGYADVEQKVPFTPETRQMVASVTKMFTAISILKLRDQGKLKLEDSLCSYTRDCPDAWKPVTIAHMVHHTSGIPDYESRLDMGSDKYFEIVTAKNAVARIIADEAKFPLDFIPGDKFKYSNTAYILLGVVVENLSGMPLGKFVEKNFLKPAGMKNSAFFDIRKPPANIAYGYSHGDLGWAKTLAGFPLTDGSLKRQPRLALSAGDGGLYSTVDDLLKWSRVMDGKPPVTSGLIHEIFTTGKSFYGAGWFILTDFNRKKYWHNGVVPGHVSDLAKFPDEKLTIIVLSNLDRTRMGSVTRDLTSIVLGLPYDLPVRGTVTKLDIKQIEALEGEYKAAGGRTLVIKNEPDYLTGKMTGAGGKLEFVAGFIPLSPTEFYFPFRDGKVIFTLGENGTAVKVNLRYRGEDHFAERV